MPTEKLGIKIHITNHINPNDSTINVHSSPTPLVNYTSFGKQSKTKL